MKTIGCLMLMAAAAWCQSYDASKAHVVGLLKQQEFAAALDLAKKLNKQTPDDVAIYGYMADAEMALGDYEKAVENTQWMLRLRPGNAQGLLRAGLLRELHGDANGALEALQMAYDATPFANRDERAGMLAQISRVDLAAGDVKGAEGCANSALEIVPGDDAALGALGEVRMAQKRFGEAAELFRKRYTASLRVADLFTMGKAEAAGGDAATPKTFAEFERLAMKAESAADNANRELVEYYLDYAKLPEKALVVAENEAAQRHDAFTLAVYARALRANGQAERAEEQIARSAGWPGSATR